MDNGKSSVPNKDLADMMVAYSPERLAMLLCEREKDATKRATAFDAPQARQAVAILFDILLEAGPCGHYYIAAGLRAAEKRRGR